VKEKLAKMGGMGKKAETEKQGAKAKVKQIVTAMKSKGQSKAPSSAKMGGMAKPKMPKKPSGGMGGKSGPSGY
jgi:L-cysteine desulfidase